MAGVCLHLKVTFGHLPQMSPDLSLSALFGHSPHDIGRERLTVADALCLMCGFSVEWNELICFSVFG